MHLTNKPIRKDYQTLTWMNTYFLPGEGIALLHFTQTTTAAAIRPRTAHTDDTVTAIFPELCVSSSSSGPLLS